MKQFGTRLMVVSFILLIVPTQLAADKASLMEVHFIDVGQGDSILIKTPSDKNILIDGGPPDAGDTVVNYLQDQQVDSIDLMVATHPDYDHLGGLVKVLKQFPVDNILDNGKFHITKTYLKYMHQIRRQMISVYEADEDNKIKLDPFLDIQILNDDEESLSPNQSSIVLKIDYLQKTFLLTGDIDKKTENKLMKAYNIEGDFLKIPHHGSHTSSTMSFIEQVDPKAVVLSYGRDNQFGHPVERVVDNLKRIQTDIYSTAIHGNIVLRTNGTQHIIQTEKDPLDYLETEAE